MSNKYFKFVDFDLDIVIKHFAKEFKEGAEVHEFFIDTHKRRVIFKLWIDKNLDKPGDKIIK